MTAEDHILSLFLLSHSSYSNCILETCVSFFWSPYACPHKPDIPVKQNLTLLRRSLALFLHLKMLGCRFRS